MAANLLGMAFIPYYDNLMNLLKTNPELHKTAKAIVFPHRLGPPYKRALRSLMVDPLQKIIQADGMFKQVAWGAAGTVVGATFGGPVGAMLGGIAGSVLGYRMSDDYQSLIDALQDISDEDKAELVRQVQELVGAASIEALTRYIGIQAQRSALLDLLRSAAKEFTKGG